MPDQQQPRPISVLDDFPSALSGDFFDPHALIRREQAAILCGVSPKHTYRLEGFPDPVVIGPHCVRFREIEVRRWIAARITERAPRPQSPNPLARIQKESAR